MIVKLQIVLIIILYLIIVDIAARPVFLRNFVDVKDRLIFTWYNYPLLSLCILLCIIAIRYTSDVKALRETFYKKYANEYHSLLSPEAWKYFEEYIPKYIKNICYLQYSKHVPFMYIYSMLDMESLTNIEHAVKTVISNNINGSFVECGVWRGGTGILVKSILNQRNVKNRDIYLLDSYDGMEEIGDEKSTESPHVLEDVLCAKLLKDIDTYFGTRVIATSEAEVTRNLKDFGCLDERVHLIKGWFDEKYPWDKVGSISMLRLDCDYYYPTRICLEKLYDKVSIGGFIILDEYYLEFMGERKAVDEFRKKRGIKDPIQRVNRNVAYWVKSG